MPLSFDPASIMAPGGIASGLDNLGAAVMNAMNRRAERKYGLEAEQRRRNMQLEDETTQRHNLLADESRRRRFQWWHDAASAGPETEPGYMTDAELTDMEKAQLEAIREGARNARLTKNATKVGAGTIIPAPPSTRQTKDPLGRPIEIGTTIKQGIDYLGKGLGRAAQAGKTAVQEAYKQKIATGEKAAAIMGDEDPVKRAMLDDQRARVAALEKDWNEGVQRVKTLPGVGNGFSVDGRKVEGVVTGSSGKTIHYNERGRLTGENDQKWQKIKLARQVLDALGAEVAKTGGIISPFSELDDAEQLEAMDIGDAALQSFRTPLQIDAEGNAIEAPELADAAGDALAADEPVAGVDETVVQDADAATARVAELRAWLQSQKIDDTQFTDEDLIAEYGMTDQE